MATTRAPKKKPIIEARTLSLDDWLALVATPVHKRETDFEDYRFPTDKHAAEYLATVHLRTEQEVKVLLRSFLIPNGSLGADSRTLRDLIALGNTELEKLLDEYEFVRRLFRTQAPWEGTTWVLDLLPTSPTKALEILSAYFAAHFQFIPDGRADGLFDARAVIRQRYLHFKNPREALASLTPSEFEFLVGALYRRMGYSVIVTQQSRDGGVDVIARKSDSGASATVLIQCKHYQGNVSVHAVRELTGVVLRQHANKGIIVCSGDFTRTAGQEARLTPTVELVGYSQLNVLLNRHLGTNWPTSMNFYIRGIQHESRSSLEVQDDE